MKSNISKSQLASSDYFRNNQSENMNHAVNLFIYSIIRGKLISVINLLRKKFANLLDLQTYLKDFQVTNRIYAGIQSIKISQIHGSEGRVGDFDYFFNPIQEHTRSRWLNIAKIKLFGSELPPVELIQVGENYFVRDGHHRISVSKALGEDFIDAEVTKWDVEPADPSKHFLYNAQNSTKVRLYA